jgi:hypothetical protein
MAIFPTSRGRIDHFSNPSVRYKNRPTGIANDRDNALKINLTGNTVADFRPAPDPIPVPVTPFQVSVTTPLTYPACSRGASAVVSITCGVAPFQIRWQNSSDGITWTPAPAITNNNTGYAIVTPCGEGNFWVKAIVTDAQNQVRTGGSVIELIPQGPRRSTEIPPIIQNIYPNPLQESTQIQLSLNEPEQIFIEISNLYGTVHRELPSQSLPAGTHTLTFARDNLPQGLYYLKLRTASGYIETKSLVINP